MTFRTPMDSSEQGGSSRDPCGCTRPRRLNPLRDEVLVQHVSGQVGVAPPQPKPAARAAQARAARSPPARCGTDRQRRSRAQSLIRRERAGAGWWRRLAHQRVLASTSHDSGSTFVPERRRQQLLVRKALQLLPPAVSIVSMRLRSRRISSRCSASLRRCCLASQDRAAAHQPNDTCGCCAIVSSPGCGAHCCSSAVIVDQPHTCHVHVQRRWRDRP